MQLYDTIADTGKRFGANKIVLFGSRARGDNNERSDIDIAVFGMPEENQPLFAEEIENLPTLLCFDLVFIRPDTSESLLTNIRKDGKILMSRLNDKLKNFSNAVCRLDEALAEYSLCKLTSSRDGVIQRFEFCAELAWKTVKEYLAEQGYSDINSPKAVMKQAFADKIIDNETVWLEILQARNMTSHIYDDNTASDIFKAIESNYIAQFKELYARLSQ